MTGVYRRLRERHRPPVAAARGGAGDRRRGPSPGRRPRDRGGTAVSLAPAAGKAELVIAVKGAVDVRDFLLTSPANPLYRAWRLALPDYLAMSWWTWALHVAWLVALAALAVAAARPRQGPPRFRRLSGRELTKA